jgi:hypothetical protein
MSKSQTNQAAEALVNAVKNYQGRPPKASSKVWRKVITSELGITKLYTSRLDKILSAAEKLGLTINDEVFVLKAEEPPPVILETTTKIKPEKKIVRRKNTEVMGRLLEAQLRDMTQKLSKGQSATVTFCVCPKCGCELKILGVAEGVYDEEVGDVAE